MEKIKIYLKNNYWIVFPIVHIIASFIYERFYFYWNTQIGNMFAVPINASVGNGVEFFTAYIISKLISIAFIWMIWKLVFAIIGKKIPLKTILIFGILFVGFCAACVAKWPQSIIGDGGSDHVITYLYAKSFIPYYWHSAYTSCLYAACFMVAPTAFSLPVLQCLMVISVLGYVYTIIDRYTTKIDKFKWAKYLTFFALISPMFIDFLTNSWRCCFYAILAILFFAMIIEIVLLEDSPKVKKLIAAMIIGAILSVWRSEGIIYGILGFLALLIWGYRYKLKKIVIWMLLFCVTFFILGRPSAIGQDKYYGKDYLMVCFVNPLANIFNDSNNNLTYDGAKEDVEAIEKVVPVSVLAQYAYHGYLSNNYSKGFVDIDQTGASDEEGGAFIKAAIRIILHNPKTYVKTQVNIWFKSFDFTKYLYIEDYSGEKDKYNGFSFAMWETGEAELYKEAGVVSWQNNPIRIKGMNFIDEYWGRYNKLWSGKGFLNFKFLGLLVLIFIDCVIAVVEIIEWFKRNRRDTIFGLIALMLLAVIAATILMMPTPYIAYFYTFIYCSFMLGVIYGVRKFGDKKAAEK